MDVERFWRLIEESRREAGDCEEQARVLANRLALLPAEEILSFHSHFDDRRRESYRWDVWAVAYIINGGCSDDGFDYFRGWLIAQGRDFFETVMRTPERVGEGVAPGAEHDDYARECESILYAAQSAYEIKTGQEMPLGAFTGHRPEPLGEPWEEDDLERLYPELTRRFFGQ